MKFDANKARPRKRGVQLDLTRKLRLNQPDGYVPKTVLILCGPSPLQAIGPYLGSGLGDKYVLLESDPDVYREALDYAPALATLPEKIELVHSNLFQYLETTPRLQVSGLDLDFCETLNKDRQAAVIKALKHMVQENNRPSFWIRMTSSLRGFKEVKVCEAITAIKKASKVSTTCLVEGQSAATYRDGCTMHVYQGYFTRKERQKPMKMSSTKAKTTRTVRKPSRASLKVPQWRTYKDLPEPEQRMVKLLMQSPGSGFTAIDIQHRFQLSQQSIAALKAHNSRLNITSPH